MVNKIYFAGSITGGREDAEIYSEIIACLRDHGDVLTEHVGDKKLSQMGEVELSEVQIHDRDMELLSESDAIVAEVTKASLGVGYELGRMAERNSLLPAAQRKSILCLYRPQTDRKLSAMIAGSPGIKIVKYSTMIEARIAIDRFFASLSPNERPIV